MNQNLIKEKVNLEKMFSRRILAVDFSKGTVTIRTDQERFVSSDYVNVESVLNDKSVIGAVIMKAAFIDVDLSRFFIIKTSRGIFMIQYESTKSFNMNIYKA